MKKQEDKPAACPPEGLNGGEHGYKTKGKNLKR